MPEIGTIHIDFQVLKTHDPRNLLIADTSDWKHIENKTSIIKITMPGGRVAKELYWEKNKVNIFNSSSLGITPKACTRDELRDLPDGFYTIKVIGSPDSFNLERKYLRTEKMQLDVDKLYVSLGVDFDTDKKALRGALMDIKLMIGASESATRLGDIKQAHSYFKEAKKLLRQYTDCEGCV